MKNKTYKVEIEFKTKEAADLFMKDWVDGSLEQAFYTICDIHDHKCGSFAWDFKNYKLTECDEKEWKEFVDGYEPPEN